MPVEKLAEIADLTLTQTSAASDVHNSESDTLTKMLKMQVRLVKQVEQLFFGHSFNTHCYSW